MSEEQIKKMREAQADVARKQAEIDRLKREKAELEEKVRKIEVERGLRAKEPKEPTSRNLDDVWATINELKRQLDNVQVQSRETANNLRKTETNIRILDGNNVQEESMDEDDVRPSTSTAPQILPLKLRASDDTIIACDEDVACKSNYIKMKLERLKKEDPSYGWLDRPIPVRKVDGPTLVKILEWCEKHRHEIYIPKAPHEDPRINLTKADLEYMDMTSEQLLAVCIGANDIGVPGIVDIITQKIADMAKGKSVEEIREIYCLHDDDDDPKNKKKKKKKKAAISIVAAAQPSSNNGK